MLDDALITRELSSIGYFRRRRLIYQASWGTNDVEHFIYVEKGSRQYLVCRFGLRNRLAEAFGLESLAKYGHPNFRITLRQRDRELDCSIIFEFGRLDAFSHSLWPRVYIPNARGSEIAILIADFVRENILPLMQPIVTLETFLNFLVSDSELWRWYSSSRIMRVAQIVATAGQLGLSKQEIRRMLTPHERLIAIEFGEDEIAPASCTDRYLEQVMSDWTQRASNA